MTAVAFDTLRFVRTLRDKAKMSPEQAEGLADAVSEAIQGDLATKADLASVKTELKAEIEAVSHKLDLGLTGMRKDLDLGLAGVRKDLDLGLTGVRKDLDLGLTGVRKDLDLGLTGVRKDLDLGFAGVRKDLDLGLAGVRSEFAEVRAEMRVLEQRMTVKLGGLVAAAVGILIAAIRYLPPAGH